MMSPRRPPPPRGAAGLLRRARAGPRAQVVDAAVIGVPHARFGEVPKAFVVLRAGAAGGGAGGRVTPEDVAASLQGRLADFKQLLGGVEFVERIPKSASGKILRKELRVREAARAQQQKV